MRGGRLATGGPAIIGIGASSSLLVAGASAPGTALPIGSAGAAGKWSGLDLRIVIPSVISGWFGLTGVPAKYGIIRHGTPTITKITLSRRRISHVAHVNHKHIVQPQLEYAVGGKSVSRIDDSTVCHLVPSIR